MRCVRKDVHQDREPENPPALSHGGEAVWLHTVREAFQSGRRPEETQAGAHGGETVLLQPVWKELQSGGESEKTPEDPHRRNTAATAGVEGLTVMIIMLHYAQVVKISTLRL